MNTRRGDDTMKKTLLELELGKTREDIDDLRMRNCLRPSEKRELSFRKIWRTILSTYPFSAI